MTTVVLDSGAPPLLGMPSASLCDDRLMPVMSALAEAAGTSPARQHQHESWLQLIAQEKGKHRKPMQLAGSVRTQRSSVGVSEPKAGI